MPRETLPGPWISVVARAAELMQELVQLKQPWKEDGFAVAQLFQDVLHAASVEDESKILDIVPGVSRGPLVCRDSVGGDEGDVLKEILVVPPSGSSVGMALRANVAAMARG